MLVPVFNMAERLLVNHHKSIVSAVEFLRAGYVVAVPTDTLYGLACDSTNSKAVEQMYNIKQRNEHKPVALCFSDSKDLSSWAKIGHLPSGLLVSLLPGPVTLILHSNNPMKDRYLQPQGKIGVRVPDYQFIREVANKLGRPLALTSANLSNEPSAICCTDFKEIWDKIPAVFDGGVTNQSRAGSTVVDLSEFGVYRVVREGVAFRETIEVLDRFELKEFGSLK